MHIPQKCSIGDSGDKLKLKKINKIIRQLVQFARVCDVNYNIRILGEHRHIELLPPT